MDYKAFQELKNAAASGAIAKVLGDKFMVAEAKKAVKALSGKIRPLEGFDLASASPNCGKCNGTGVIKHVKRYGGTVLVTVVCECVS